jgi:hypothetical protein
MGLECSPARADTRIMVLPLRIFVLVLTASTLACAAMTLVLVAARS